MEVLSVCRTKPFTISLHYYYCPAPVQQTRKGKAKGEAVTWRRPVDILRRNQESLQPRNKANRIEKRSIPGHSITRATFARITMLILLCDPTIATDRRDRATHASPTRPKPRRLGQRLSRARTSHLPLPQPPIAFPVAAGKEKHW